MPDGHLVLQTLRSHDQYNTTIYGLDDRYRGIHGGRRVVFVHPDDLAAAGVADGEIVDIVSVHRGVERVGERFRVVAYPTAARLLRRLLPRGQRAGAPGLGGRREQHAHLEVGHGAAPPACRDAQRPLRRGAVMVVGTGVDPVTFRFSGGRSAN